MPTKEENDDYLRGELNAKMDSIEKVVNKIDKRLEANFATKDQLKIVDERSRDNRRALVFVASIITGTIVVALTNVLLM